MGKGPKQNFVGEEGGNKGEGKRIQSDLSTRRFHFTAMYCLTTFAGQIKEILKNTNKSLNQFQV